ncbi:hypothetical protein BH23GEM6_BH23GEM6_15450 [soil metagenome]
MCRKVLDMGLANQSGTIYSMFTHDMMVYRRFSLPFDLFSFQIVCSSYFFPSPKEPS